MKYIKKIIIYITSIINSYILGINLYWYLCGYKVYTWIKHDYVRTDYGIKALDNMDNLVLVPVFIIMNLTIVICILIKKHKRRLKNNINTDNK